MTTQTNHRVERQRIADRLSQDYRLTYEQSTELADRILEKQGRRG
jgi:hypothetical protein